MMFKLKTLTAAILVAGISNISMAEVNAPEAPDRYLPGPFSPSQDLTNINETEREALTLMESMMMVAESFVKAQGCNPLEWDATVTIDDILDEHHGYLDNVELVTDPKAVKSKGQKINVDTVDEMGTLSQGTYQANPAVQYFDGNFVWNEANNMKTGDWESKVQGSSGRFDKYSGLVIKDFYRGAVAPQDKDGKTVFDYFLIVDWGLQSVNKAGFPIEKYWQRSKMRRDNGYDARTVFVKDRLVGRSKCRLTLALEGLNGDDYFDQSGILKIERVAPEADSCHLDAVQLDVGPNNDPVLIGCENP